MKKMLAVTLVLGLCAVVAQATPVLSCSLIKSGTFGGVTYDVYSVTATDNNPAYKVTAFGGGFYGDANVSKMMSIRPYLYDSEEAGGYRNSPTLTVFDYDAGLDQWYDSGGNQAHVDANVKGFDSHWSFTTAQFVPVITAPAEAYNSTVVTTITDTDGYYGRMYRATSLTVVSGIDTALQANSVQIAQIVVKSGEMATFTGTLANGDYEATGYGFTGYTLDLPSFLVPEPATMTLLALGALALIRRRRA